MNQQSTTLKPLARVCQSTGAAPLQSVPSARHIPDGQGIWSVSLQWPLSSQIGVSSVSYGQVAVPHTVPAGWKLPTTQVALPVAHEIVPTAQAFDRGQVPPAVQATQLPALQTMFVPHPVPSGAAVPLSWQVIFPVSQLKAPT